MTARDAQILVNGEYVKFRPSGYSLQRLNGEGEWTTVGRANDSTLAYTPDGTPTRILWRYVRDKGLTIILR